MTPFDPFTALGLPPQALVDRRVPKTLLIKNGSFASGDRRRIREGIQEMKWLAVLKPTTVGIAAYRDAEREYLEIAVLRLDLRPNALGGARLVEMVHRAVPYPVLLISRQRGAPELSLAHKRRSMRDSARIVVEGDLVAVRIDPASALDAVTAFRDSIALERQPRSTLHAVYQGWIDAVNAFRAAKVTGTFSLPASPAAAADRQAALTEYRRLLEAIATIYSNAPKETQITRRAELNIELARLQANRDAARARL